MSQTATPNLQAVSDALYRLETQPDDPAALQFARDCLAEAAHADPRLSPHFLAALKTLDVVTDSAFAATCARIYLTTRALLPSPANAATPETDGAPTAPAAADAPTAPITVEPLPEIDDTPVCLHCDGYFPTADGVCLNCNVRAPAARAGAGAAAAPTAEPLPMRRAHGLQVVDININNKTTGHFDVQGGAVWDDAGVVVAIKVVITNDPPTAQPPPSEKDAAALRGFMSLHRPCEPGMCCDNREDGHCLHCGYSVPEGCIPVCTVRPAEPLPLEPPGRFPCSIYYCSDKALYRSDVGSPVGWYCEKHYRGQPKDPPDEKLQLSVRPCEHKDGRRLDGGWRHCPECGALKGIVGEWAIPVYAQGIEQDHAQLDANRDRIAELEHELVVGRSFVKAALETVDKLRAEVEKLEWRLSQFGGTKEYGEGLEKSRARIAALEEQVREFEQLATSRRERIAELTEHLHEAMVNT